MDVFMTVSWGLLLCMYICSNRDLTKEHIRLKIRFSNLADKAGYPEQVIYNVSEDEKTQIKELLSQNKKLEAIKYLKDNHKMKLLEAKIYVESL